MGIGKESLIAIFDDFVRTYDGRRLRLCVIKAPQRHPKLDQDAIERALSHHGNENGWGRSVFEPFLEPRRQLREAIGEMMAAMTAFSSTYLRMVKCQKCGLDHVWLYSGNLCPFCNHFNKTGGDPS